MILALLGSGQLAHICPFTLIYCMRDIPYQIETMNVINNDKGDIKYINAISPKDSSGTVQLYLFNPGRFTID